MDGEFDISGLSTEEIDASFSERYAYWVWVIECGWPMHCLNLEHWYSYRGRVPTTPASSGLIVGKVEMPIRPTGPGFTINTLFYAGILWLLILGPFALRRFLRVRRGLCPKCAYPMGESAVCSECGNKLPQRARTADRSLTGLVA